MTNLLPRILVITTKADLAADYVIAQLHERRTDVARINTEDLPFGAQSTFEISCGDEWWHWKWRTPGGMHIRTEAVEAVWFRRHRLPLPPADILPAHAEYCLREAEWYFRGNIFALAQRGGIRWMSEPARLFQAESKIYQLSVARDCGFTIPDTLVSNEWQRVVAFFEAHERNIVAKPLRLGYFDYGEQQTAVFTTQLTHLAPETRSEVEMAPVIYQPLIPKACDVRITVVGRQAFGAEIDSQSEPSASVDWRRTETSELPHATHRIPCEIEEKCFALLDRLGLSYGAFDFVLTPDGKYVFLEVNPSGQWAWLEDRLALPISKAIAEWLTGRRHAA